MKLFIIFNFFNILNYILLLYIKSLFSLSTTSDKREATVPRKIFHICFKIFGHSYHRRKKIDLMINNIAENSAVM